MNQNRSNEIIDSQNYLVKNVTAHQHLNKVVHYHHRFQFEWLPVGHVSWTPGVYKVQVQDKYGQSGYWRFY